MLHPAHRVGPIAAFEPLYLALAQLQQPGGFAYAQPPGRCILNHLHSLKLFLTHRHHPGGVAESRCSQGATLSGSNYMTSRYRWPNPSVAVFVASSREEDFGAMLRDRKPVHVS